MSDRPVLCIFTEMTEYALARGLRAPVDVKVDEHWHFAIAGKDPAFLGPDDWPIGLEPYHFAVWFNGFLAGVGTPFGGEIAAGEAANEETFSKAIGGKYHGDKEKAK